LFEVWLIMSTSIIKLMVTIQNLFKGSFRILFLSCLSIAILASSCAILTLEKTDHFDGTHFFNVDMEMDTDSITVFERLKWYLEKDELNLPDWIEDPPQVLPPSSVGLGKLRVAYINHATMLIQLDEVNVLVDPIWSDRASMFSWLGPKRIRAPGIDLNNLPSIHVILISHNHYDHLDIVTLKRLTEIHQPKIFVGLGVKALLDSEGITNVTEMDWWQEYDELQNKLKLTFVPGRHSSARGIFDRNKTLWGGFVISSKYGNVYFAGDTSLGKFSNDIKRKFDKFRLAILPLGYYKPRWMMRSAHINPEEAVLLHKKLNVHQSVGMHFGTFYGFASHNYASIDQHEIDLALALKKHNIEHNKFWVLGFGEGRYVP